MKNRFVVIVDGETEEKDLTFVNAVALAKAVVAGSRGATEVGLPAWADPSYAIEAYEDRDGDENSPVAVIAHAR